MNNITKIQTIKLCFEFKKGKNSLSCCENFSRNSEIIDCNLMNYGRMLMNNDRKLLNYARWEVNNGRMCIINDRDWISYDRYLMNYGRNS